MDVDEQAGGRRHDVMPTIESEIRQITKKKKAHHVPKNG